MPPSGDGPKDPQLFLAAIAGAAPIPNKLFYRIGEVAELVGVKPHVLRYWESEFAGLKPLKTRGAHRQYRRQDVELAMVIRSLLRDQGFTVAGAKKRLREIRGSVLEGGLRQTATREVALRGALLAVREELLSLRAELDRGGVHLDAEADTPVEVVVEAAVPVQRRKS